MTSLLRPDRRPPGVPAQRSGAVRVVIIDDTADYRLLVRTVLGAYGDYEVVGEAGDGASGVELVRRLQPDIVLLDLAMPVMDGREALPRIRAASPGSRIIVLSGFSGAGVLGPMRAAGAATYVQKGAAPAQIVAAIADAVGGAQPTPRQGTAAAGVDAGELEQLRAAVATAAHELRAPASVLAGLSRTLRTSRDRLDAATVDQLLDAIIRQATVLDRVTADLLTTSQLHRGTVSLDPRPMPLGPTLRTVALAAGDQAPVPVVCADDVWVRADQVRVEQMLSNLLANAFKYGAPPVSIDVECHEGSAVVSVVDGGAGVPAAFVPRLFEQYARADGQRAAGTGIGLHVVASLAAAQGGRAWFEPTAAGASRFRFALPLTAPDGPAGGPALVPA